MGLLSPTITGALRVVLQVVSSHKRPMLEVFHQTHNRLGPEVEYEVPDGPFGSMGTKTKRTRHQEIFVQFILANIGGERAENIRLQIDGELKRNKPRENFGELFQTVVPQMGSGQVYYLFRFDEFDLYVDSEGEEPLNDLKKQSFTITVQYDAPNKFINFLIAFTTKLKKTRSFKTTYTFFPQMVAGDLPPVEYA